MKTNTRRKFIRNTSLTATGLFLTSITKAKDESSILSAIGCSPNEILSLSGSISSVKSGKWSDPATWGGKLPAVSDMPLINTGHTVVFDQEESTISGLTINNGATLQFDPLRSGTLQSSKNIVVFGILEMVPSAAKFVHLIRFINVDESKFIGGGHMVLDTDIGLWVKGSGRLNLVGAVKSSWINLESSATAGSSSITLKNNPTGWAVGDEIVICPTQKLLTDERVKAEPLFERIRIKSISSKVVTLAEPLKYDHLKVEPTGSSKLWTAEVLNLNKNVRIEGTESGKSHVFVHSNVPQTINNVGFRYLGPRSSNIGRYALHFHHCKEGTAGTVIQDCIAFDQGSHCFVPHTSHGITFKNCVVFNCLQEAFWWDEGDITHSAVYENCVVALGVKAGFMLGMGDDNVCNNCVCVGAAIGSRSSGGFLWEANNEGVWEFKNNLAHTNYNGLRVWQNTQKNHVIENYDSYNNFRGAFHGAYINSYTYRYGYHYNSLFIGKATSSQTSGVRFEFMTFDAAGQETAFTYSDSPIAPSGNNTNKFLYCTFKNYSKAPFICVSSKPAEEDGSGDIFRKYKHYDFIHCDFGGKNPVFNDDVENGTRVRIQPVSGQPYKIEKTGPADSSLGKVATSNIAAFAPKVWGKGNGWIGTYYNNCKSFDEKNKKLTRNDSIIAFDSWAIFYPREPIGVHHLISSETFCVRWTGKIMAQYSEAYTFRHNAAGGSRLWVNGQQLIDSWVQKFDGSDRFAALSSEIKLEAGKLYDIVLEYFDEGGNKSSEFYWKCPSMIEFQLVPQSQLFSGTVTPQPIAEKTTNVAPVVKAGDDMVITLPTNSVTLDGSSSTDSDGTIVSYAWTKLSGPAGFAMANTKAAVTAVNSLEEGEYVFQLEVKDDKGLLGTDSVKITVKPKAETAGLVAKAGADVTLQLPSNSTTLNGGDSSHSGGKIASYKWTKVSGPSQFTISNSTAVSTTLNNLVAGTYVFRLEVKDEKGLSATDELTITVNEESSNDPIAIAGDDLELSLPTNSTRLNGYATTDPNGRIVSYKWTKTSGPSKYEIANPAAASTVLSDLVEGEYVFHLEVKDYKGRLAKDDVKVQVKPGKPEAVAPKASAGEDQVITLPTNNVKLRGKAVVGSGGAIEQYKWSKVSGPKAFKIVNPNSQYTTITQLTEGTYIFQLKVVDASGAQSSDQVTINVLSKDKSADTNKSTEEATTETLQVSVSPNPSSSVFRVNLKSNSDKPITLRLFDRWGKEVGVIRNVKSGTSVTIPGNLKRGTYFGTAEQGFQKKTMTLIKL